MHSKYITKSLSEKPTPFIAKTIIVVTGRYNK